MADDRAGASTTANASGGNREQVPSPAPLLSAVSEKRPFIGGDVSAGPPTGYITHLMGTYPKKGSRRAHSPGTTRACEENLMLRNLP